MVEHDLRSTVSGINVITPAVYAVTTVTGSIVDTAGFESLTFFTETGAITDGVYTFSLEAGDESDLSDAVTVSGENILGANPLISGTDDDSIHYIGTNTKKRFVRLMIEGAGVSTGGLFGSTAVLGHAKSKPTL